MKRLAVYTVQTGSKGDFDGFGVGPSDDFDLILFTDDPHLQADGCATRPIDTRGLDPARSCRRPKLLPHRYLADYEWSFYIDANVKLRGDPARLLAECAAEPFSFFCFRHPERDCLYAEAELVIRQDYDDERRVREQIDHYRMAGFPGHSGLIAGGALLRRHHEAEVIGLGEEWYEHVLRFSKRDQLSFNFVAWRRAFRHGFLPGGLRDNPFIQMTATALIPLVAIFGAPEPERISAVLALVALILEGAQQLNQYQQNWIGYRSTCEALKHEKHLYLAGAGPYAGANDALLLLADRVEGLISQEHAKWVSVQEHAMRTGKTQLSRIS